MSQKSDALKAGAEQIVRDIRRRTRKQYSAEEKIRIVLAGLRGEDSIAELCRREGIADSLYYSWSKEFLEAGEALAPICDSGSQQDSRAGRNRDHKVALRIRSTRASVRSFTWASTRTRLLHARAISMIPSRSSIASRVGNHYRSVGVDRSCAGGEPLEQKSAKRRISSLLLTVKGFVLRSPLIIREVEQYAAALADRIDGELREFPPPTFRPGSLLHRYLRSLCLWRPGAWIEWSWNGDVGPVGVTEPELREIIQRKSNRPYRTLHELWLVIYGGVSLSRAMYTSGVVHLNEFGDLGRDLSASPFQRVYLIGSDEDFFVWSRETESWSIDESRMVGSPSSG